MTPFRIVQISDLHLGPALDHHRENWEIALEWLAEARPDLVIVTGDLVDEPDEPGIFAFAREQMERMPAPWRAIPGNHDIGDCLSHPDPDKHVTAARRVRWLDAFGPDWWRHGAQHWTLLGLNAQLLQAGDGSEAQWDWLAGTLAELPPAMPVALFIHRGLFLDHPSETAVTDDVLHPEARRRLAALFGGRALRLVASGHKHQYRSFSLGGSLHVWTPSVACVNKAPDVKSWGLRIVGFVEYRLSPSGGLRHRLIGDDFLVRNESYMRK
jgi:3',5'-cyclic AMP phosphodiesterase CpdA